MATKIKRIGRLNVSSISIFKFYVLIYFWLPGISVGFVGACSSCDEGLLSVAVLGPPLLRSTGSRHADLSSRGPWAESAGSGVVTPGLSCSAPRGIFPDQRLSRVRCAAGGFLSTAPPASPNVYFCLFNPPGYFCLGIHFA